MSIGQALQNEIEDSKRWLYFEKDDSTYKEIYKKIKIDNLAFRKFGNPNLHVVTILNLK
jgi:hypothetical protein